MARRMYDLDNGTENIKVKSVKNDNIIIGDEFVCSFDGGDKITFNNDGAFFQITIYFPHYMTTSRPSTNSEGAVIYDSTLKKCILYNGTAWVNLDGTSLGE